MPANTLRGTSAGIQYLVIPATPFVIPAKAGIQSFQRLPGYRPTPV